VLLGNCPGNLRIIVITLTAVVFPH
jgi:hypothetical protein